METRTQIFATTHATKRGETVDADSLKRISKQFLDGAGEIDIEHDPRNPPAGRMVAADFVTLPEGHFGLQGTLQLFDETDYRQPFPLAGLVLRNHDRPITRRLVIDEHFYGSTEAKSAAREIALELEADLEFLSKNAVEPLTWLIFGLGCGFGAIASSFLAELGKDAYKATKKKLLSLLKKTSSVEKDRLVIFEIWLSKADNEFLASVILTNPTSEALDSFLREALPQLDEITKSVADRSARVSRVAFSFDDSKLNLLYVVRKDGLPFLYKGTGIPSSDEPLPGDFDGPKAKS
jgi:hypothetical protein